MNAKQGPALAGSVLALTFILLAGAPTPARAQDIRPNKVPEGRDYSPYPEQNFPNPDLLT